MNLSTITMPKEEAEQAFAEYRDALRAPLREKLAEAQQDYDELDRAVMQGYKALAKGQQLLRLSESLRLGGTERRDVTERKWRDDRYVSVATTVTLPKLAVCRADARRCSTRGVSREGGVIFRADDRESNAKINRVDVPAESFDPPPASPWGFWYSALVPSIPPPFRPPHKLSGYHVLWEAEWDRGAPVDPALLKHLGGELYAVLAVWDLTPLEQAVLAGREA